MKRLLAIACLSGWLASPIELSAQFPQTSQTATNSSSTTPGSNQPSIYRDPYTGQLYQQEFQTVDQPVTTWQRKYVNQTVVTPQTVVENQQVPQTYYVAKTEYVLQTKLKGWWNPFAQPTYAYEYVPVTRWLPQTQMVTRQVPTVKMLASTQKVPVDEPVRSVQKVTQVVTRLLPAGTPVPGIANSSTPQTNPTPSASNIANYNPPPAYTRPVAQPVGWTTPAYAGYGNRNNSQPLVATLPILSRQPTQAAQPGPLLSAPFNGLREIVRATTAPFNGQSTYSSYSQPMNIAAQPNPNWSRDLGQAGMPATIVR